MKSLIILTMGFAGILLLALRYPEVVYSASEDIGLRLESAFYEKRVELAGLKRLTDGDLRALLPLKSSNIHWYLRPEEVLAAVKAHPFVQSASLHQCAQSAWYEFSCFRISVNERRPRFVAILGEDSWIVGSDGAFMVPLSDGALQGDLLQRFSSDIPKAIVVKGLLDGSSSPAYLRGKLQLLSDALDLIEGESGERVASLSFEQLGEIKVLFQKHKFPVTFEFGEGDLPRLREEAQRLRTVLLDLREKGEYVQSIDLAFDTMGVVRMSDEAAQQNRDEKR